MLPQDPLRHSTMMRVCGAVALFGAIFPVAADIASWFIAGTYSPIAQSISALAVGPSSTLLDMGIYGFAAGAIAAAIGLDRFGEGGRSWRLGAAGLALTGLAAALIAGLNEYAGQQNTAADLHQWAFYAVALLFPLSLLCFSAGFGSIGFRIGEVSFAISVLWILFGPFYYFVPEAWSGAVERCFALVMLGWLAAAALFLIRHSARPLSAV